LASFSKAARDYRDLAEEVIKKIVNVNAQKVCTQSKKFVDSKKNF